MVKSIMVIGLMIKCMGMGSILGQMAIRIRGSLFVARKMAKELSIGRMAIIIMAPGSKIQSTEKEHIFIKIKTNTMETLLTICVTARDCIFGPTAQNTMVAGEMASKTVQGCALKEMVKAEKHILLMINLSNILTID